uniref:Helix-turn-helix domain-containing protein n=1 Tax=Aromatoleum buckelii TaxID=200254 RepID=A0ABX1N639_9RHOO
MSAVQIRDWIKRYNDEELEGLADRPRPGQPSRLRPEQVKAFLERLHAEPPADSGLSAWRGKDMREFLAREFGATYSISGVYTLLHRLKQSALVV